MTKTVSPIIQNTAQVEAPAVLLPYQQVWIADDAQLKVGEKSRRIGLTWAEAADDVLIAASEKSAGGMNVYYIGYNQDMAIEYVEACAMWAKVFNHAASEVEEGLWEEDQDDKHIKTYTIRFPDSGHRIVALSSRPANLRGKQGVVVIDEAAFHDKLDELLKAAVALLIWGGKVRIISTHNGNTNPFNELVQEIRKGQRADADEELDVVPSNSAGAYLPGVLVESRMVDGPQVVRLERGDAWGKMPVRLRHAEINDWCEETLLPLLDKLDPQREHALGEDFARTGDLSILAPGEIGQDMVRRCSFLLELKNIPFAQQRQIIFYILHRLPRLRSAAMDARGNGQQLAEEAADEFGHDLVQQVMLSDKWYSENLPLFKAAFEDAMIEIPKHDEVARDLRAIKMINGVPKLGKAKTNEKGQEQRHGDSAIALAMLWFASQQEVIDTTVLSGGHRETSTMFQGYY
ncbi:MAG: hypothetical protein B6I36_02270 [Desulfobacteraceae bacterium 4572_35.1]|nr:MAG: hypothetical protein B6I36_02270 [Desulfobacteraceae bacterium 4572_35.1]